MAIIVIYDSRGRERKRGGASLKVILFVMARKLDSALFQRCVFFIKPETINVVKGFSPNKASK